MVKLRGGSPLWALCALASVLASPLVLCFYSLGQLARAWRGGRKD
jgi:hypothetical protein